MKTQSPVSGIKPAQPLSLILSKLWVFLSLNYILCDVLSNMEPAVIRSLLEGNIGGIAMTEGFLLLAGVSLEIPFMMVVLSAILPRKVNRSLNVFAAILIIGVIGLLCDVILMKLGQRLFKWKPGAN